MPVKTKTRLTHRSFDLRGRIRSASARNGRRPNGLRFIDLFCGAGGLGLGFRMAGYRSVWAVDYDTDAVATYKENFKHDVYCGDIRQLHPPFPDADVLIGGPPCQGFSPLGKMSPTKEHSRMNELWREYLRVLREVEPTAFVVENVPEFLASTQCEEFLRTVARLGYLTERGVLKAVEYGVPQKRRRGFILGSRISKPVLPEPQEIRRTVRDAIGDLPLQPTGKDLHTGRSPRPDSMKRYRCIPPGGNRFDLLRLRPDLTPPCWHRKKKGSTDVMGRLEWDKPALTIRTEFYKPEKGRYLHPAAHRPITHREAARLQTFPDNFVFCGSKIEVAKQIGNAVPPLLARAVAEALLPFATARKSSAGRGRLSVPVL